MKQTQIPIEPIKDTNTTIAEQNTERLIQAAYQPEPVPQFFAASLEAKLIETAQALAKQQPAPAQPVRQSRLWPRFALAVGAIAACLLGALALSAFFGGPPPVEKVENKDDPKKSSPLAKKASDGVTSAPKVQLAKWTDDVREAMMPRIRPTAAPLAFLKRGDKLTTKAGERRLVELGDGTRLYVNEKTQVESVADRHLTLHKGQIYLEVAPKDDAKKFFVKAGSREMTATGTHFGVQADAVGSGVVVTQGTVAVKGIEPEVVAGQRIEPGSAKVTIAPRASHALEWTRELMAAAETPMVPACQHGGGALVALDPQGQEIKLALRQYHIDVHIEDGFARTTIDQTYFNTTWERLEGTFYFPLPPDASLSRLAMYVVDGNQCKLMEGGMAERKHAADVYETIRYQRRDPALLEWLDGSTFKMRVFPLEAKQEKRIVLSYTQKLPSLYGVARYRFPGGLNLPVVREWSFNARIKSGQGMNIWSTTHGDAMILPQSGDTLVKLFANNIKPESDVALEMQDKNAAVENDVPRLATFLYENHQYLMLRYRSTLPSLPERKRRDWIVLFESSAGRDPLLAGTQVDVVRQLLKNAEYDDTFVLLTANSNVTPFNDKPQPARPKNVDDAIKFLQKTHLVGALDLQQGLQAALQFAKAAKNPHIVHVGSGIPAMGERDAGELAKTLPESVRYVGVGVGKRWNRSFMKAAAERTNGLFTQINPDETVAWRAFELLATLNTPRLLDVKVVDANDAAKHRFLMETSMIAQGEEICAVTRVDTAKNAVPGKVLVKGTLDGKPFAKEIPVVNVLGGAGYLPRTWAKLEIDRLLAKSAAQHKNEIIELSKAMYVMSPFTSLLVLETDADYERFKVDKGRKDHWAMYACPPKIPLVYEPEGKKPQEPKKDAKKDGKPTVADVLGTMAMYPVPDGGAVDFGGIRGFTAGIEFEFDEKLQSKEVALDFADPATFKLRVKGGDVMADPFVDVFGRPSAGSSKELGAIALKMSLVERRLEIARGDPNNKEEDAERTRRRPRMFFELEDAGLDLGKSKMKIMEAGFDQREAAKRLELIIASPQTVTVLNARGTMDEAPKHRLKVSNGEVMDLIKDKQGAKFPSGSGTPFEMPAGMGPMVSVAGGTMPALNGRVIMGMSPALSASGGSNGPPLGIASFHSDLAFGGFAYKLRKSKERPGKETLRYERPAFEYDKTLFTNLVQYAPGLSTTWADIIATLETEAEVAPPTLGVIDAGARKLIERARAADWHTLTVPAQGPLPSWKIHFNGIGQFAYERILVSGLREEVICDGKTLFYLYPEIGLASKRPFSRHHQEIVASFDAAFLPSAEEFARAGDVKTLDANTIAIIPFGVADLKKDDKYHRVHLIFARDGRLSERRVVEMPTGKTVLRQLLQANGTIEWLDADGKSLAKETHAVAAAKAPSLTPRTAGLVVMALPIRHSWFWFDRAPNQGYAKAEIEEQLKIAICLQWPNRQNVRTTVFIDQIKEDGRLGFLTLLNASGSNVLDRDEFRATALKDREDNALARSLVQSRYELLDNNQTHLKKLPGPKDGFLQKLGRFRDLWLTWHNNQANRNPAELPKEKAKVMEFLQETTSPTFAYAILDAMYRRANIAPIEHMMAVCEKRFGPIASPVGLGYVFRYEHARSLWQAGVGHESAKLFRDLHADTLKYGVLPPIDANFRDALQTPTGDGPRFIAHTRKTVDDLVADKRFGTAFRLAAQMTELGDEALADEILTTILARASEKERDSLTLASIHFHHRHKHFAQADRLLGKLLEDKELSQYPELWRWRSNIARDSSQTTAAMAALEKALDLEYAELPELVNLESIRTDYRTLMTHYQKIAEASASLEKSATKAFLAKVIRTADRWRLIDADGTEASTLAGKILFTMGERDLAWDYWTTPIDLHPAESRPWLELAETMKSQGDLEKADRAFGLAFEAEATNPDILMKRAQNAVRMGETNRARQLYRQIADRDWQERFAATVEQAKALAER